MALMRKILAGAICSVCLLVPAMVQAATIFYTNEATFVTATGGTLTYESFESFVPTNDFASSTITGTGFEITTDLDAGLGLGIRNAAFLGLHATDGTQYVGWAAAAVAPDDVTFSFVQAITAFGVMITDPLDGGITAATLVLTSGGGDVTVTMGSRSSGEEFFIGLVSSVSFNSVTFTVNLTPSGGDGIGFDELRFGSPVPVPAALWLFGSGLGMLGWIRRRQTA